MGLIHLAAGEEHRLLEAVGEAALRRLLEGEEARDLERALELSRQEEQRRKAQSAEARARLSRPTFRTLVLRDPQPREYMIARYASS